MYNKLTLEINITMQGKIINQIECSIPSRICICYFNRFPLLYSTIPLMSRRMRTILDATWQSVESRKTSTLTRTHTINTVYERRYRFLHIGSRYSPWIELHIRCLKYRVCIISLGIRLSLPSTTVTG